LLSPTERRIRARLGAFALHAQRDPHETTAAGRAAFLQKFLDEVDPNRELPETERLRRAESARKAYMAKLALASARARGAKATRRKRGPFVGRVRVDNESAELVGASVGAETEDDEHDVALRR
jgi:hypothetical protein